MRTLMISAHPEWVEKILKGEKTIEVRPWIPKGELPLKVLIYVTKGKPYLNSKNDIVFWLEQEDVLGESETTKKLNIGSYGLFKRLNGNVVASFILNKAEEIEWTNEKISLPKTKTINVIEFAQKTCLLASDLSKYIKGKVGYAWHIDDLEIFYEPKELGEYGLTKAPQKMVWVEK